MPSCATTSDTRRTRVLASLAWLPRVATGAWVAGLLAGILQPPAGAAAALLAALAAAAWQCRPSAPRWQQRALLACAVLATLHATVDYAALEGFPFHYRVLQPAPGAFLAGLGALYFGCASATVQDRVQHLIAGALPFALSMAAALPWCLAGWPGPGHLSLLAQLAVAAASLAWLGLLVLHGLARWLGRGRAGR